MVEHQNIILLIDTSGDEAGVALTEKGKILADRRWESDHGAGRLLKEMDGLLKDAGKKIKDVKKIAVCEGPGRRYSALRTGVAAGMMLAYAGGVELVAYTRKSSDGLFGDMKLRPRLVIVPKYEKFS